MEQNYSSTKFPTVASTSPSGLGTSWANPNNIKADDGSSATLGYAFGGDFGASITGSSFGFQKLPAAAVIDGIEVAINGSNTGCYGDVSLNIGIDSKDMGALNGSFGGPTDLWGNDVIDPADIATLSATVNTSDVSGGDGFASIDSMQVTVYWHIDVVAAPADVPTRFAYKVYSRDGNYLGELPKVTTDFAFPQDINSAAVSMPVTCAKYINNEPTVTPLETEAGDPILTESNLPILAVENDLQIVPGNSTDEAIFKNSNIVKVWMYNQYYPNGKLMFSGVMRRVSFKYGGGDATVSMMLYSDGTDLSNYIARGYPFVYTLDQQNTSWSTSVASNVTDTAKIYSWNVYGQSFKPGAGVTNIGAITLKLQGSATVTISLYDGVNGNLMGSATKVVSAGSLTDVQFQFASPIKIDPSRTYFFAVWPNGNQSITHAHSQANPYANGMMYNSNYSGGSGGGSFVQVADGSRDMYFKTYSATPTTTTSYNSQDPTTGMAHGALADYNDRGGKIVERNFQATGLTVSYTFVVATLLDFLNKVLDLSPSGFYYHVDIGTDEIDILQASTTPDFTVVRGKHFSELDIDMSIENVKNDLLLTGGDTGSGVNLFKEYVNDTSKSNYGQQLATKTDNRVTLSATADAIGESFIDANDEETQQTSLTVLNSEMDITLLTPGKTIGFKNFGNFIDDLVLQIARREPNFSKGYVTLTLGVLPVRMSDEIQRINRDLLNEQTISNPSQPS